MKSLAECLGVQDPGKPEESPAPAPSTKITAKAFCTDILSTVQYRESLLRRIILDSLPPAIEAMLWHYAKGKPVERVEVKDKTNTDRLADLTIEQLEERALVLMRRARQIRMNDEVNESSSEEDDGAEPSSIH